MEVWGTPSPTPGMRKRPVSPVSLSSLVSLSSPSLLVRTSFTPSGHPLARKAPAPIGTFFFFFFFVFSTGYTRLGGEGVVPGVYPDPLIPTSFSFLSSQQFSFFHLFITGYYARHMYVNFWPFSQHSFTFTPSSSFSFVGTRFMPGLQVQPQVDAWEYSLIFLFTSV